MPGRFGVWICVGGNLVAERVGSNGARRMFFFTDLGDHFPLDHVVDQFRPLCCRRSKQQARACRRCRAAASVMPRGLSWKPHCVPRSLFRRSVSYDRRPDLPSAENFERPRGHQLRCGQTSWQLLAAFWARKTIRWRLLRPINSRRALFSHPSCLRASSRAVP